MRSALVATVLLALAGSAGAQLTEAQATSQLKAAIKDAKKGHAASMGQRAAAALSAIDTFVLNVPNGAGAAFDTLFTALESFQNGLYEDINAFQDQVAAASVDVLTELAAGSDLDGAYPAAFFDGIGGPLDDFRAALDTAQTKALGKVVKKLEKAATKLSKTCGVYLSWFLEPAVSRGRTSSLEETIIGATRVPLVLHTVLALGFDTGTQNGYVRVAGMANDPETINVRVVNEGPLGLEVAEAFELGSPYWHAFVDAEGAGLPDGNLLVVAEQGTDGTSSAAFVSVR